MCRIAPSRGNGLDAGCYGVVWDVLKREVPREGCEMVETSCTGGCHQVPCGDAWGPWSGALTPNESDTSRRLHVLNRAVSRSRLAAGCY